MKAAERLYVWLNNGTFVEENGCSHPLDVIAVSIGCTERTVIRAVKQLEAEGRIRVKRSRTRGRANTYWVDCWTPSKRCPVLAVLAGGREEVGRRRTLKRQAELDRLARRKAFRAQCHPKENSKASRAQTTPVNPFLAEAVVNQRCGREAKNEIQTCDRCGRTIQPQGGRSMDQPKRRHLYVADLTCPHCQEKQDELERKDGIIRTLQVELNRSMEGEAEWREAAKAAGRATIAAKAQRTRRAKEAATAEQVNAVIDCWVEHRPKTNRDVSFPEGGKRWEMIEKALTLVAEDPVGPVKALKEAVEGMHLCPYLVYGKRQSVGKPKDLRVRPEDCFRDEVWLDRARSCYQWAKALPQERCWALYEVSSSFSESWFRLTMDALAEPPAEDGYEVDGIVVRP